MADPDPPTPPAGANPDKVLSPEALRALAEAAQGQREAEQRGRNCEARKARQERRDTERVARQPCSRARAPGMARRRAGAGKQVHVEAASETGYYGGGPGMQQTAASRWDDAGASSSFGGAGYASPGWKRAQDRVAAGSWSQPRTGGSGGRTQRASPSAPAGAPSGDQSAQPSAPAAPDPVKDGINILRGIFGR